MQVTTVSANVRFSKALGDGTHKTVELGAEAAVSNDDTLQEAQARLYEALGQQIKALWSNGNGKAQELPAKAGSAPTPAEKPEHYCRAHSVPFKRYEKEGKSWYTHKGPDGKWCREK